ncbi:MAG TPA: SHOCT domain-containing protein [Caldilineae bacterium]|nr:SHOCT domain-containing protein [Caldilineae bacterium]
MEVAPASSARFVPGQEPQTHRYLGAAPPAGLAAAAPDPAPAQDDYIAELQRLAGLRDAGIITNDEFEAKKKQLLGL